jgi:DNA-binding transcriptional ArsR family regulator
MDAALQALADPRRRQILALVRERELAAGEIARQFDVTRPAISQHLTVLRNAGLVSERRAGTRRLYRARPSGIADVRAWLEEFWDDGLARLQRAAEQEEASGRTTGGDWGRHRPRDQDPGASRDGVLVLDGPDEDGPLDGP